jgi:hypothetical protein
MFVKIRIIGSIVITLLLIVLTSCQKENDEMISLNYGNYSIPEQLELVIEMQKQLEKDGLLEYEDLLGYYFSYDGLESRYLNTPLDVISFARPGSDGIHYGFLTDFGDLSDLSNAYIVRVSPMDFDDPVKIVAKNFHDFMRIISFSANAPDIFDISTSKDEFEQFLKEYPELSTGINNEKQNKVREMITNKFQLEPIDSLYDYLQKVKQERENEIVVSTEDGIGVVNQTTNLDVKDPTIFELDKEQALNIDSVKHFFENSPFESKLVFLRDAQSKGLLYDNEEVKLYLKEQLRSLNLNDEAERLPYPDKPKSMY